MEVIYFIYGLAFFTLAFSIFISQNQDSDFFFAKNLYILGYFAFFHALDEWVTLYELIYKTDSELIGFLKTTFLLLSNFFLFEFSRSIMANGGLFKDYGLLNFPIIFSPIIFYGIIGMFIVIALAIYPNSDVLVVLSKYIFCFIGSVCLGISLLMYAQNLKFSKDIRVYLNIAGATFLAYAFVAGIIENRSIIFEHIFTSVWFLDFFGFNVQIARSICAIILAISSVKILKIFNVEADRKLKKSFEKIKEFNAFASHQLKTPLSALRLQTEVTLARPRSLHEYQNTLKSIDEEILSLQKIVENMLLLTRLEDSKLRESFTKVAVDDIVIGVFDEFLDIAKEYGVQLDISKIDRVNLNANADLLRSMFENLIDNAIKYSTSKKVTIRLTKRGFMIKNATDDPVNLEVIFSKFYRTNEIKGRGFGLGLYIAKKIAQLHRFKIYAKKSKDEIIFIVKF